MSTSLIGQRVTVRTSGAGYEGVLVRVEPDAVVLAPGARMVSWSRGAPSGVPSSAELYIHDPISVTARAG